MDDDDELCLCFHVTRRKVVQFIRVNRPKLTSQLSECYERDRLWMVPALPAKTDGTGGS